LISKRGDFWIGTDDRGVVLQRGKQSIAVSEEAGFHQERVRAMFEDRGGIIWVATQNGIERIVEGKIESFGSLGLVSGTSPNLLRKTRTDECLSSPRMACF